MSKKQNKKNGFCIYYFLHRGIGRTIEETKDWNKRKKKLMDGQPNNGLIHISCGPDKKKVLKQYNNKIEKEKKTKRLKRLKRKSLKTHKKKKRI